MKNKLWRKFVFAKYRPLITQTGGKIAFIKYRSFIIQAGVKMGSFFAKYWSIVTRTGGAVKENIYCFLNTIHDKICSTQHLLDD